MNVNLVKREFESICGSQLKFVGAELFDRKRRLEIAAECHCPYHNGKIIIDGMKGSGAPITDGDLPSLARQLAQKMKKKG